MVTFFFQHTHIHSLNARCINAYMYCTAYPVKCLNTPLHAAAEGGHVEAIHLLLQNRFDIEAIDKVNICAYCLLP
jgi:hypothetical protein